MNREQKLKTILDMLDIIAHLDESYGINKKLLRQLYTILSSIKDEDTFEITYNAIISNMKMIFEELEKLGKKIDKTYLQRDENIEKRVNKINLSALAKTQFKY